LAHVFFSHGKNLEVSTFRDFADTIDTSESTASSSAPISNDNTYGTEETDALRRDLTINGLFLDVSTLRVIDYVNGMDDLRSGTIRIIGEPDKRFAEDPVRMLRAVRHSARNGFQIEPRCWESIVRNAQLLESCSQVRVFDEIKKDLSSGSFLTILSLLADTGLLEYILPELLENNGRLLSAESDCAVCLEKIDDLSAAGKAPSATTSLAILALFMAGDSIWLRDLTESFINSNDLSDRLRSCFTRLTVPRKERERIHLLLALWARVLRTPLKSFKAGPYKRSSLINDLIEVLEITQTGREDTHKLKILTDRHQ
jgi:tRNA nucleotidyltransferase/poly(A) polymerase